MPKSKTKDPSASGPNSKIDKALKAVYADGFNIYAAINRLKKNMNRKEFPETVLLGVCESYWRSKPGIKNRWPWFISAMEYQTRLWICDQHEKENAENKRGGIAQSIKDIMKGL